MSAAPDPTMTDNDPARLADAIARVETGKERIILTRAGKAVVALVPIADLEAIEDAEDTAAAADALTEFEHTGKNWPIYTVEELAARWGMSLADSAIE